MSDRGVSIQFVLEFCQEKNLWQRTTAWVCYNIIKPACEKGGPGGGPCRYVDLPSVVEKGVVGRAKTFVSHAWGAPFGLIVVALLEGEPDMNRHIWIDIFAVLQFEPKPEGELRFDLVIRDCSSFLLVVPYVKEIEDMAKSATYVRDMSLLTADAFKQVPMLRVWCLVEVFAALKLKNIVFVMKVGRLQKSKESIGGYSLNAENMMEFLRQLREVIDVAQSRAANEEDRVRLLAEHQNELEDVNAKVRGLCSAAFINYPPRFAIVPCAAMGDSNALSQVMNESEAMVRRMNMQVCALKGFRGLLRELLDSYPVEDREQKLMLTAAAGGQVDCLKLALEYKCDMNVADMEGSTPCIIAATLGHTECLQVLIEARCDVDAAARTGMTACMGAASGGHAECLRLLLAARCNFKAVAKQGLAASTLAAVGNRSQCLKLLIEAGCDLEAATEDGKTVCMLAAEQGCADCLKLLIEAGCDVNVVDKKGKTALAFAKDNKRADCVVLLGTRMAELSAEAFGEEWTFEWKSPLPSIGSVEWEELVKHQLCEWAYRTGAEVPPAAPVIEFLRDWPRSKVCKDSSPGDLLEDPIIAAADNIEDRGVSLLWTDAVAARAKSLGVAALPTRLLVELFVKPLSAEHSCAFYYYIPMRFRRIPTVFLSHSWDASFHYLMSFERLVLRRPSLTGKEKIMWLDVFAIDQRDDADHDRMTLEHVAATIDHCKQTVFLIPGEGIDRRVALTPIYRSWCLFEVACTPLNAITVCICGEHKDDDLHAMYAQEIGRIELTEAKTTLPDDKAVIEAYLLDRFESVEQINAYIISSIANSFVEKYNPKTPAGKLYRKESIKAINAL